MSTQILILEREKPGKKGKAVWPVDSNKKEKSR